MDSVVLAAHCCAGCLKTIVLKLLALTISIRKNSMLIYCSLFRYMAGYDMVLNRKMTA